MAFVNKLIALLTGFRLPAGYNVIPFLSVHDPEEDVKALCKAYVSHAVRSIPKRARALLVIVVTIPADKLSRNSPG